MIGRRVGKPGKLVLNKETIRALRDDAMTRAVGGTTETIMPQTPNVDTQVYTVCGFEPPPWVSTSPPTHLC